MGGRGDAGPRPHFPGTSHAERSAAILVALTHHPAEASPTTTPRGSATHETHQSLGTTTEKMNDALKNAKHASLATIRDVIKSVDGNVTSDAARYNDKLAHAHAARADAVLAAYEASKRTVSLFSFAYGQLV